MLCAKCGVEEPIPFVCSYCGKSFCGEHRIPENHDCEKLWMARPPAKSPLPSSQTRRNPFQLTGWLTGQPNRYWFSSTELKHLGLGALLVALVALNFSGSFFVLNRVTILLTVLFTASFLLHELAHKFMAQRAGLWSEFRLTLFGALLTAISIVSPLKLIAPGAVVMSGQSDVSTVGKISIAGPLTNIALGFSFWIFSSIVSDQGTRLILSWGAEVNAILAIFNLIPFGVLDGQKVMAWNFRWWAVGIGLAVVLLLVNQTF